MGSGRGSSCKRNFHRGGKENSCPRLELGTRKIDRQRVNKVTKSASQQKRETNVRSGIHLAGEAEKFFNPPQPVSPKRIIQITRNSGIKFVQSSEKLKLQLFPIDGNIRKGLEKDGHNPHLELTLSGQKKITSVLKHLNTKWGNSNIAIGELVLFPYDVQAEALTTYRRWSLKDTESTAADVHAVVGSPDVFRLRYCWLPNENFESRMVGASLEYNPRLRESREQNNNMEALEIVKDTYTENKTTSTVISTNISAETGVGSRNGNVLTQSFGAWADCLTNVSMGQLIGDTVDANNCNLETLKGGLCPQQMLTCDSFDAAIAAHISRYWNVGATNYVSQMSVLDAEDTCHAFPVKKFDNLRNSAPQPSPNMFTEMIGKKATSVSISSSGPIDVGTAQKHPIESEPQAIVSDSLENAAKLSDLSWNDSLGPFDLGLLSSSRKIISGDSISLSNFFSSSRDALQNISHPCPDGNANDLNKKQ